MQDYNSKYYSQTYRGNFTGIAFGPETSFAEAGSYPIRQFTPNALNKSRTNDPYLLQQAQAQQRELNYEKRKAIMWDIQKQHAAKMYYIPNQAGSSTSFVGAQSWVQNAQEVRTRPSTYAIGTETLPYYWKKGHA